MAKLRISDSPFHKGDNWLVQRIVMANGNGWQSAISRTNLPCSAVISEPRQSTRGNWSIGITVIAATPVEADEQACALIPAARMVLTLAGVSC